MTHPHKTRRHMVDAPTKEVSVSRSSSNDEECVYLTLGDGDFTFSLDLAHYLASQCSSPGTDSHEERKNGVAPPAKVRLVATGIDTWNELTEKYRDTSFIVNQIQRINSNTNTGTSNLSITVLHEVNAIQRQPSTDTRNMPERLGQLCADHVIFNHPHLGTEDAIRHSRFLCHLFHSVATVWMKSGGFFHLTLAPGQAERWKCALAAERHGFELIQQNKFIPPPPAIENIPTYYQYRRHQSGKSFASRVRGTSEIFTYRRRCHLQQDQQQPHSFKEHSKPCSGLLPWYAHVAPVAQPVATGSTFYSCPHCDKEFKEERSLRNHVRSKHNNNSNKRRRDEPYTCTLCNDRVFDSQEALNDHTRAKHAGVHDSIRPDWCLQEIVADATSTKEATCPICGAGITAEGLESHWLELQPQIPQGNDEFKCCHCRKAFHENRARLQHENVCTQRLQNGNGEVSRANRTIAPA